MDFQAYDIALLPVIIGLVELLKKLGLPEKFSALASLILGVACGFIYVAPGDPAQAVLTGVVLGLSACGLYSGTKNTIEGVKKNG